MLNKLGAFLREQKMVQPGDTVIAAVSGGSDSVALLFGLYLLKDKLGITLEAVHFNHNIRSRGEEALRDELFVREFCDRYDIPLHVGSAYVTAGEKGLEAAARDARYAFFQNLNGKVATAHTADDNAETVLMHLVRGTGLKGLGGIAPIRGKLIRPMLTCTQADVNAFLEEWCLPHMEDSGNHGDAFLRNRLRHHVMPYLKEENPRLPESVSRMALRLRADEKVLAAQAEFETLPGVDTLKAMAPAIRSRCLERFLKESGVKEPEEKHITAVEALLYSDRPSARVSFSGGITIARQYDCLVRLNEKASLETVKLPIPGVTELPGWRITCTEATRPDNTEDTFTVIPQGEVIFRSRQSGDRIRLSGGSKSLKKLFIDRKIPAAQRENIPVLADETGILGVYGIGVHQDRAEVTLPAIQIHIEKRNKGE